MSIFEYVALAFATVVLYELVRWQVLRAIKRRLNASTKEFVRSNEIRLDRFKLTRRSFLKTELLADRVIAEAVQRTAKERNLPVHHVYGQVEEYLDEIIPGFSILSYYKLGLGVTRTVVNLVYDVILDTVQIRRASARIPENAVVIYLMNHRSNFDFLLVGLLLSRTIALSYAVGEWARVWPLEHLFRSFGSYFVRRGERDPLYHTVLKRYVQSVSRYGITQGIFPEGGLTRDGSLRPPKTGLLQYLVELKLEPEFDRDILLVPVAINYDHVLEDRVLVGEAHGTPMPPGLLARFRSAAIVLVMSPVTIVGNVVRVMFGRIKRHGYATASFGEPISLDTLMRQEHVSLETLDAETRKDRVKAIAEEMMRRIGAIIPVTPVPLVTRALLTVADAAESGPAEAPSGSSHAQSGAPSGSSHAQAGAPSGSSHAQAGAPSGSSLQNVGATGVSSIVRTTPGWIEVSTRALEQEVHHLRAQLRASGARIVTGREFEGLDAERQRLEEGREDRTTALLHLEEEILDWDETRETLRLGLELLAGRLLVRRGPAGVRFKEADRGVLEFYANSIRQLFSSADPTVQPATHDAPVQAPARMDA